MKTGKTFLGLLGCLAVMGFSSAVQPQTREVPADARQAVEKEIKETIHDFMAGFSAAKCTDVSAVSRFVRDGMIYVTNRDVFTIPLSDYEQGLRDRVCSWVSHAGVVDSVTVDVLSRDVAVAAWRFHDEVKLNSGEMRRYKGSTLMTLVRAEDGWKITSTMSAEE
jgi:ketosteroid isomerase-like protein